MSLNAIPPMLQSGCDMACRSVSLNPIPVTTDIRTRFRVRGGAATTDILESAVRKCGTTAFPGAPARAPAGREAGRRSQSEASG
jgi:hypothetical protein